MANRRRDYVLVEDIIGSIDMNYDWELAEHEALKRAGLVYNYSAHFNSLAIFSPSDIERRAEQFLEKGLAAISPRRIVNMAKV